MTDAAMPPDVERVIAGLRGPYYAARPNLPREAADLLESLSAQLRECRQATLEEAAKACEEACVQIGCTAIEAEDVVRRTRNALAEYIRRALSSTGRDTAEDSTSTTNTPLDRSVKLDCEEQR